MLITLVINGGEFKVATDRSQSKCVNFKKKQQTNDILREDRGMQMKNKC